MMVVAFIMRPWILIMRAIGGALCFILADDVLILATGTRMMGKFARALNETRKYLQTTGQK